MKPHPIGSLPPGDDARRERREEEAGNQLEPGDDARRERREEDAGNQLEPGDDARREAGEVGQAIDPPRPSRSSMAGGGPRAGRWRDARLAA